MDISPVLDEVTVIIGLITPFVTALVAAVSMKVREGNEWVRGAVSVIAVAASAAVISIGQSAGFELSEAVDQGSGIIAIHIASWLMVTKTAVEKFRDNVADVLGR